MELVQFDQQTYLIEDDNGVYAYLEWIGQLPFNTLVTASTIFNASTGQFLKNKHGRKEQDLNIHAKGCKPVHGMINNVTTVTGFENPNTGFSVRYVEPPVQPSVIKMADTPAVPDIPSQGVSRLKRLMSVGNQLNTKYDTIKFVGVGFGNSLNVKDELFLFKSASIPGLLKTSVLKERTSTSPAIKFDRSFDQQLIGVGYLHTFLCVSFDRRTCEPLALLVDANWRQLPRSFVERQDTIFSVDQDRFLKNRRDIEKSTLPREAYRIRVEDLASQQECDAFASLVKVPGKIKNEGWSITRFIDLEHEAVAIISPNESVHTIQITDRHNPDQCGLYSVLTSLQGVAIAENSNYGVTFGTAGMTNLVYQAEHKAFVLQNCTFRRIRYIVKLQSGEQQ